MYSGRRDTRPRDYRQLFGDGYPTKLRVSSGFTYQICFGGRLSASWAVPIDQVSKTIPVLKVQEKIDLRVTIVVDGPKKDLIFVGRPSMTQRFSVRLFHVKINTTFFLSYRSGLMKMGMRALKLKEEILEALLTRH